MQKFKAPDVKGMQIHNYREKESRTNPDIDEDRTQLNYDLVNDSRIDFKQAIQKEIDERYIGNKAIRKDAVMLCEFVVTSDKDFFDGLDPDQEKRFFEESLSFLQERYGKENILYAIVHKDEKTPHMHVGMVPITDDGKLAAKQFFGKKTELQQLQDKFHEHVTEKGFSLERGVSSDRKHITTQRLKAMTVKEEIQSLNKELESKKKEYLGLSEALPQKNINIKVRKEIKTEVVQKIFGKSEVIKKETGNVVLTPKQLKELTGYVNAALAVKEDYERLQTTDLVQEHKRLREENKELHRQVDSLYSDLKESYKINAKLQERNRELNTEISSLKAHMSDLKANIRVLYQQTKKVFKEQFKAFRGLIKNELDMKGVENHFEREHKREMTRQREYDRG